MQGPWSDGVPSGWQIRPLWSEFRRGKTLGDGSEELLSVYRDYGVIPKSSRDDNFNKPSEDLSKYQRVSKGDLVVNKMKAWQGSLGISNHDGIVSPAYFVYKATGTFERRYAHYLLRSKQYADHMAAISSGIRPNQWDLDPAQFAATPLLVPPPAEQRAIADYLDRETAQIDAFIAKNEELITLLTERRFALISHSVNAGLEPSLPVVESGNEWLGPVPRHWRVLKLRHVLAEPITDGPHITPDFLEDGVPFLSVDGIVDGELDFQRCRYVSQEDHQDFSRKAAPIRGDILMGKAASVGKIARVKTDRAFSIWSPLALLRPAPTVLPAYIELCLKSASAQAQFAVFANYNTQANISMGDIGEVLIAMPTLDEQGRIVEAAEEELRTIDDAIDAAQRSIELARERRAALISAAVTGKIDVGVAA